MNCSPLCVFEWQNCSCYFVRTYQAWNFLSKVSAWELQQHWKTILQQILAWMLATDMLLIFIQFFLSSLNWVYCRYRVVLGRFDFPVWFRILHIDLTRWNLVWKTTLNWSLRWNRNLDGRWLLMEDSLWWLTTKS